MSPPKTGTTSIRKALELIGGEPFVWEDWHYPAPTIGQKHICHLPQELADYYVFATVRNPYTRHISRHLDNRLKHCDPSQKEFEEYTFGKKTNFRLSCCGWLNLYSRYKPPTGCVPFTISRFLKMETLDEDFHQLPFVDARIDFPHENTCKYPEAKSALYFTDSMRAHLFKVWRKDFETFGYSSDIIKLL